MQTRVFEKIKSHLIFSILFSGNHAIYEIIRKSYGRARQATDYNVIGPLRFSCWTRKAKIRTHIQNM